VALEKAGKQFGELLFTVPEGWKTRAARVDGRSRRLRPIAPGVMGLGLTLVGQANVVTEFEKIGLEKVVKS
jgi:hypothetical protein